MNFSEISKLQFGNERHTLFFILKLLQILLINYLWEMRHGKFQFFFSISIAFAEICFCRILKKPLKAPVPLN